MSVRKQKNCLLPGTWWTPVASGDMRAAQDKPSAPAKEPPLREAAPAEEADLDYADEPNQAAAIAGEAAKQIEAQEAAMRKVLAKQLGLLRDFSYYSCLDASGFHKLASTGGLRLMSRRRAARRSS